MSAKPEPLTIIDISILILQMLAFKDVVEVVTSWTSAVQVAEGIEKAFPRLDVKPNIENHCCRLKIGLSECKILWLWISLANVGNLSFVSPENHPPILASHQDSGNASSNGSSNQHAYIAYALIPVFFFMGLLGVLICHLLKKRGYRCTTEAEEEVLDDKIELNETTNDNDTVGHIVDYIMKNEANADVLKAMVADNSVYDPERFRVTKVEHKSTSKERKTLMSVSGVESVNGEMPATPVKEGSKEVPVTPVVKQGSKELSDTPINREETKRTGTE
ncbi:hypothetical protein lerEdw1_005436 [Lerista edwardsae]|nr:hypothetical protein lerEdw1_005436 [Lerista edwardsae]